MSTGYHICVDFATGLCSKQGLSKKHEENRKKVLTNPVSFGILIERLTKGKCFQGDEPLAPHIDLAVQMKKSEKST